MTSTVTEIATIAIQLGRQQEFEKAIDFAFLHLRLAPGYLGHDLKQCIEQPERYVLTVKWTSLEAHTVEFRESVQFIEWRKLIGPFFAQPPEVLHYRDL